MKGIGFVAMVFFLFLSSALIGQTTGRDSTKIATTSTDSTVVDTSEVLTFAEVMPQFPGGEDAFQKYLQDSIKYPDADRRAGNQGTVYVKFVVMRSGNIEGVKVLKGVSGAPGLGNEAVRVIKSMPRWAPGTMNGKAVNVQMVVPITFKLARRIKKKNKD